MNLNPFTLKELRQLTRARTITLSLVLFLFIGLFLAYIVPVMSGIGPDTGRRLFALLNAVLLGMSGIILPCNVYMRLNSERGGAKANADFTLHTPLPVSAVVDGKLRSALALMVLFATATFPFAVVAYLLHGIPFDVIAISYAFTICFSCMSVHTAVAVASLKLPKMSRNVLFCLIFAGSAFAAFVLGVGAVDLAGNIPLKNLLLMVLAALTFCLNARAYAIAFLSPSAMERDCAIKATLILSIFLWGVYACSFAFDGVQEFCSATVGWRVISTAAVSFMACYAMAQPAGYSRRILSGLPKSGFMRFFIWPFSSGAANTFLVACAVATALSLFEPAVKPWVDSRFAQLATAAGSSFPETLETPWKTAIFFMYFFSLLLVSRALWRFIARSSNFTPVFVPTAAIFLFGIAQTIPNFIAVSDSAWAASIDIDAVPFYMSGVRHLERDHLVFSAVAFFIGAVINAVPFFKAVRAKPKA